MTLDMHQQNIMDHYKHPRNMGHIPDVRDHAHVANPLCGDELDFFLVFDHDGKVSDVKFDGRGCTITIAGASMLSETLKGMTRASIEKLSNDNMIKLLGVPVNPARLKCATLSLEAVQQAIGHH